MEPQEPPTVESIGSGLLADPHHLRADSAMIEQAIKHNWQLRPELFALLPKIAELNARGIDPVTGQQYEKADRRATNQAIRLLLVMHQQNIGQAQVSLNIVNQQNTIVNSGGSRTGTGGGVPWNEIVRAIESGREIPVIDDNYIDALVNASPDEDESDDEQWDDEDMM